MKSQSGTALTAPLFTWEGARKGEIELPAALFGRRVSEGAIYYTVRAYLNNQRQGTVSTKTRAEVKKSGKKPFKQKGTGRARQGSRRSPVMTGGGVSHGPKPRDHTTRVPRKIRRLALVSALSDRAAAGRVMGLMKPSFQAPKTKMVAGFLDKAEVNGEKILFLLGAQDKSFFLSSRNLKKVHVRVVPELSAYDVLWSDRVFVTEEAVEAALVAWTDEGHGNDKKAGGRADDAEAAESVA